MRIEVSEDLQRELVYQANARLLRRPLPSAAELASLIVDVLEHEGPRHHEPDLLTTWAEAAVVEVEELVFELESALDAILEELDDDDEPWSAHRVLTLLEEEPLWCIRWGLPGSHVPVPVRSPRGLPLPIELRAGMVAILDALELYLFQAYQAQRSVHDRLPDTTIERAVDLALDALRELRTERRTAPLGPLLRPSGLPSWRTALIRIQRWKLSVAFDATPDDDDGEWALRILERLYSIEWVIGVEH